MIGQRGGASPLTPSMRRRCTSGTTRSRSTIASRPSTMVEGREAIVLRDRVVPLVHLRRMLGVSGDAPPRCPIIVLEMGERRSGIVVDGMLGQQEIVVKGDRKSVG